MSAQEELEKVRKVEQEMRDEARISNFPHQASILTKWADEIAAIREGLGKAQGEAAFVVAVLDREPGLEVWTTDAGEKLPVGEYQCFIRPPSDSAQVLVEALEHDKCLLESELADFADELEIRGHSDLAQSAITRLHNCKNDYRSAK